MDAFSSSRAEYKIRTPRKHSSQLWVSKKTHLLTAFSSSRAECAPKVPTTFLPKGTVYCIALRELRMAHSARLELNALRRCVVRTVPKLRRLFSGRAYCAFSLTRADCALEMRSAHSPTGEQSVFGACVVRIQLDSS